MALVTVLSLLYAWALRHDEIGSHFYNTIVCYPAGMVLSLVVERVRSLKLDSLRMLPVWALLFAGSVVALVYLHGKRGSGLSWYFAMTLAFCAMVLMLQMRMKHVSKPLYYAGRYLFFFYIYQRVPMILLRPIATRGALPFVLACLVTGIPFCLLMARAHAAIKKRIFAKACEDPHQVFLAIASAEEARRRRFQRSAARLVLRLCLGPKVEPIACRGNQTLFDHG